MPKKVRDVESFINFMLNRHAAGLLVLSGGETWPDTQELYEMVMSEHNSDELDVRVQRGQKTPEAQRMIEMVEFYQNAVNNAGGAGRIIEVFNDLRSTSHTKWSILKDSNLIRRGRPYLSGDYTARTIAKRHHMHADTMRRNMLVIVQQLAFEICYPGCKYMDKQEEKMIA